MKPILIIQPRRLGDLILTFPLLIDLRLRKPGHPLWIVGERGFYEPLMPFAPGATFFPVASLGRMHLQEYEAVINLGSDDLGSSCAGASKAALKLGRISRDGQLSISGFWQLYRESLTYNNRHNLFHWADLFRLDLAPDFQKLARAAPKPAGNGRIGLFIGASQKEKRPEPHLWASLANHLAGAGLKPVLLGGPGEVMLAKAVMAKKAKAADFCGKTSISQLASLLKTLDLLVTPDTGPMHLADWLGVPVLNLSMGNVSAYETGPLTPGQHILSAGISCYGCWQCERKTSICREKFSPGRVAQIAVSLARGNTPVQQTGLELQTVSRDELGLYRLTGANQATAKAVLNAFWQAAFLVFSGREQTQAKFQAAAASLTESQPGLAEHMRKNFSNILADLAKSRKHGLPDSFWLAQPRHSRLFAGNLQMSLQNADYAAPALKEALGRVELVQAALGRA